MLKKDPWAEGCQETSEGKDNDPKDVVCRELAGPYTT